MDSRAGVSVDYIMEYFGFGRFQIRHLLALSISQSFNGMQVLSMSILAPLLQCDWQITSHQAALMSTILLIGIAVGSLWLVNMADLYGRKTIFLLALSISLTFSLLSAIAPTFAWFCFTRGVLGLGAGALLVISSTYLSEIFPVKLRAKGNGMLFIAWSSGNIILVAIAVPVIPNLGWRWFLVFISAPLIFSIICVSFLSESLRFLLISRDVQNIQKTLNKLSHLNKRPIPEVIISVTSKTDNQGNFRLLFHPNYRRTTIILIFVWVVASFTYYGMVILVGQIPLIYHRCLQNSSMWSKPVTTEDTSCCKQLTPGFYFEIAVASCGEFLGSFLVAFVFDLLGRKKTLFICGIVSSILLLCLDFCMGAIWRAFLLMLGRCFSSAFSNGMFVYTLELYPTTVRNTSLGLMHSLGNFTATISPFIALVLVEKNLILSLSIFSALLFSSSVLLLLIPKETKDANLEDDVTSEENETFAFSGLSGSRYNSFRFRPR